MVDAPEAPVAARMPDPKSVSVPLSKAQRAYWGALQQARDTAQLQLNTFAGALFGSVTDSQSIQSIRLVEDESGASLVGLVL